MPYKDPERKRRYMSRYYEQKVKTAQFPVRLIEKGLTVLQVRTRIRPRLLDEPFWAVKQVWHCPFAAVPRASCDGFDYDFGNPIRCNRF